MNADRNLSLVIGALGGEGGGVLADWIVETAHAAGYPVQATSIPGVAQRTGATTYYIELFPVKRADLGGREPVMCLAPAAGQVDVLLYSELVETARAIQTGLVSKRTTLIASTHRVYLTAEKMAMGDGRFDVAKAIEAAQGAAKTAILFDMEAETAAAGTVISAVMFGALIGSGTLPLARAEAEAAIRAGGRGAEASLKGFAAGYARASGGAIAQAPAAAPKRRAGKLDQAALAARIAAEVPAPAREFATLGVERCLDFQDVAYAAQYLDRLKAVTEADLAKGGGPQFTLSTETARYLALWMCYEDVARVADLKSRPERFDTIRTEAAIGQAEPIKVVEFFKPGYDEIADLLPEGFAARLRAWARKRGRNAVFEKGIHVESTSFTGTVQLRLMAAMRAWRRSSSRFALEQSQIERWLAAIAKAGSRELALEITLLGRLIKGYSDTHRRGKANFMRILEGLVEGGDYSAETRLAYLRAARQAALADPEGKGLDGSLQQAGIAPRPVPARPMTFHPRKAA
jgi:indolepyruvate ferredoxin oxidoreductase beta subunit